MSFPIKRYQKLKCSGSKTSLSAQVLSILLSFHPQHSGFVLGFAPPPRPWNGQSVFMYCIQKSQPLEAGKGSVPPHGSLKSEETSLQIPQMSQHIKSARSGSRSQTRTSVVEDNRLSTAGLDPAELTPTAAPWAGASLPAAPSLDEGHGDLNRMGVLGGKGKGGNEP